MVIKDIHLPSGHVLLLTGSFDVADGAEKFVIYLCFEKAHLDFLTILTLRQSVLSFAAFVVSLGLKNMHK